MFKRKILALSIIMLILGGCSSAAPSGSQGKKYTPGGTDIVSKPDGFNNLLRLKDFFANVENKKADKIRVVPYTIEGDPILFDVEFDGDAIKVKEDTTMDAYGDKKIHTYQCTGTEVRSTATEDTYQIKGCFGNGEPLYLGAQPK